MKKVKIQKQLSLNKETVSKLNDSQMDQMKGGQFPYTMRCGQLTRVCIPRPLQGN